MDGEISHKLCTSAGGTWGDEPKKTGKREKNKSMVEQNAGEANILQKLAPDVHWLKMLNEKKTKEESLATRPTCRGGSLELRKVQLKREAKRKKRSQKTGWKCRVFASSIEKNENMGGCGGTEGNLKPGVVRRFRRNETVTLMRRGREIKTASVSPNSKCSRTCRVGGC